jgi:hypothetical protein
MSNHDKIKIGGAVFFFAIGCYSLIYSFIAYRSGKLRVGRLGFLTYRKTNPSLYWISMAWNIVFGIASLILSPLAIYYIIRHPNQ